MNTDYQDIRSYKKPNVCENLLKPVLRSKLFARRRSGKVAPAGQQARCLFSNAECRCQVSGFGCQEGESLNPETCRRSRLKRSGSGEH